MHKPDWNILIQSYASPKMENPHDYREDLWICGYIPEAELLSEYFGNKKGTILDFGCGNGKIARFLNQAYGHKIIGIDINPEAIKRAKSFNDDNFYYLIKDNQIPQEHIPFDACVINHVLPTYSSERKIIETLTCIHQSLAEGGKIVVYVDNTTHIGIKFSSFIGGEKGHTYKSGEKFPMKIFVNNETIMEFYDFYWSVENYISMLNTSGFNNVKPFFPIPSKKNIEIYQKYFKVTLKNNLEIEKKFPPAAIYTGVK